MKRKRTPIPAPGLQGDYRDTCIVCMHGTDTVLGFRGEAEWLQAGLQMLNVPNEDAEHLVLDYFGELGTQPGMVLDGIHEMVVRVCSACTERSRASFPPPVLAVSGAAVPCVAQRTFH